MVVRNLLTLDRREAGKAAYSDEAAKDIIQTYKANIAYAGLDLSDSIPPADEDKGDAGQGGAASDFKGAKDEIPPKNPPPPPPPPAKHHVVKLMAGERELTLLGSYRRARTSA